MSRIIDTPRHSWSKGQMEDALFSQLSRQHGILTQETPMMLNQAGVNVEKRTVSGTASVLSISRTNYHVRIDGMDVNEYKKNPIVLASHCPYSYESMMPGAIGFVEKVSKKDDTLLFKNMTFDTDPLADAWFQKIVKGIVRMVSIGFVPLQWEYAEAPGKKKGDPLIYYLDFIKTELTEISPVSIGANRGAFIDNGEEYAKVLAEKSDRDRTEALNKRIEELESRVEQLTLKSDQDIRIEPENDNESKEFDERLKRILGKLG